MKTVTARHHRAQTASLSAPSIPMIGVLAFATPLDEGRWFVSCYTMRVAALRSETGRSYVKDVPFGSFVKDPSALNTRDDLHAEGWRFERVYVREVPIAVLPDGQLHELGRGETTQVMTTDGCCLVECTGPEDADRKKIESALKGKLTQALVIASEADWSASVYDSVFDRDIHPKNARRLIAEMKEASWFPGDGSFSEVYPPKQG